MDSSSKAANMEFQLFDFNEVEFMDNGNNIVVEKYQHNESAANFAKGISPDDPTFTEASKMPKTPVDVEVELLSPLTSNDPSQLNQINANPDTFGCGNAQVDQLVPSPGRTNESFLHRSSSNPNLGQLIYSGFEGNDSSVLGHDDANQTTSPLFSPLIMEPTHSFPLALAEKLPQNGSYSAQPFYSEHGVNSVQVVSNGHIGSSLQAELLGSQRVESVNPGKRIMFADQFQQNNGNYNSSDNQQALPYPNLFPQSSSGIGYLLGGSTQINQQAPTWVSYKENDFYRPLAPSVSQQVNQFQATGNSDPQCYNFMLPRSSAPLRPQQLNNPLQLLNQVPNRPNASDSLLRPQHFSYQHDQVTATPGAYNQQTCSTRLPESSMPLSGGFTFQELNDHRYHQFNPFNPMTNQFGTQSSNSMLQESLIHPGSYQLPPHQQASGKFSMMHGLQNSDHHNSKQPESSFLPRLQQQQGLLNQTARPIATFPTSGTSSSSIVLNSLHLKETRDTSAPHQMETSLSSHKEIQRRNSGRRRGPTRSRFELGESSSFKRFRRESTLPQASNAERENRNFLSLHNEASTSSNSGSLFRPRPIKNSVYDPIFEGIGLPIDPHLRLFATI